MEELESIADRPPQFYIQCPECGNNWFMAAVAWDLFEGALPTSINVDTIICLECTEQLGLEPLLANVLEFGEEE